MCQDDANENPTGLQTGKKICIVSVISLMFNSFLDLVNILTNSKFPAY